MLLNVSTVLSSSGASVSDQTTPTDLGSHLSTSTVISKGVSNLKFETVII